ncbi:hypothetical protein K445DRAFT_25034 [Daldinia sp. EC12]|nr:hypothetical protein F4774DRAFT_409868 [Daldinia eschscholtzii]OTB12903.1 hypothetical protein K445DRAFT_25034 [Daldinia sp. EC12]
MPKGSVTWSLEVYRDFSRAAWEVAKLTTEQKAEIVEKLGKMGYEITPNALRQHFQKMIRDDKAASQQTATPSSPSDASPPDSKDKATPRPRRARNPRTGAKRKNEKAIDDDEDDEEQETPKKRTKTGNTSVKLEDDEPTSSQDAKNWCESTAQLEQH